MFQLSFEIGNPIEKHERPYKGRSIIAFPSTYVVLDLETTGLSPDWDNIIEVCAIRYKDGMEIDRFSSLIQPPTFDDGKFVDSYITDLTGITNEMLIDAPQTKDVIGKIANFLNDDIMVGYNINFDVCFLYDNYIKYLGKPLPNDFIDIMRFSRKLYPDMAHHRLEDMAKLFKINQAKFHRATQDVEATNKCFLLMIEEALRQFSSEENFVKSFLGARAKNIQCTTSEINPDNPLYGQYCVFTGKLERFTRKEAMQIVANLGGFNEDGVTKRTNFLILGNNDYKKSLTDGKSTKQKKAEQLKLKGQDIVILPENVFYDMINN